jgi:hypothetical protein
MHYTTQCSTTQPWHSTAQHTTHNTQPTTHNTQHTTQHNTTQHNTTQHNTTQHQTARYPRRDTRHSTAVEQRRQTGERWIERGREADHCRGPPKAAAEETPEKVVRKSVVMADKRIGEFQEPRSTLLRVTLFSTANSSDCIILPRSSPLSLSLSFLSICRCSHAHKCLPDSCCHTLSVALFYLLFISLSRSPPLSVYTYIYIYVFSKRKRQAVIPGPPGTA